MRIVKAVAMLLVVAASASAAEKFTPNSGSLPVPRPTGAVQLLGPGGVCEFVGLDGEPSNWVLADDVLTVTPRTDMNSPNHIVSTFHFRDADMHVEFLLPEGWTGNSGLYLHGLYELQILNSFGTKKLSDKEMGSLYKFYSPLVNASKPPLEWQAYDLRYRAPRRDDEGRITKPGTVTAWLNGKLVQDRAEFREPQSQYHPYRFGVTPYLEGVRDRLWKTGAGPLFLQEHLSPVRFRNVWIKPIDGQARLCNRAEGPKPQPLD